MPHFIVADPAGDVGPYVRIFVFCCNFYFYYYYFYFLNLLY